jgi:hypothetical protein
MIAPEIKPSYAAEGDTDLSVRAPGHRRSASTHRLNYEGFRCVKTL